MNIPAGVAGCLYAGIVSKIDFVTACIRHLSDENIETYLREISEALAFYQVECILSGKYLDEKYAELVALVRERASAKEVNP